MYILRRLYELPQTMATITMVVTAGTHKSGDISTLPNQHYGSVRAKVPGAASFSFTRPSVRSSSSAHPPAHLYEQNIRDGDWRQPDVRHLLQSFAIRDRIRRTLYKRSVRTRKSPPKSGTLAAKSLSFQGWAWVELNYRPHAYQATEGE